MPVSELLSIEMYHKAVMDFLAANVCYRVTTHDWETDHPRVVFIDSNDLS